MLADRQAVHLGCGRPHRVRLLRADPGGLGQRRRDAGSFHGLAVERGHAGVPGNLRPGDLVFWFSDLHHMGIYVGGGWTVHAPHTGDVVRMTKIDSPGLPIAGFRRPG
jgi:cell wall-associated NlpC family hydrolase